MTWTTRIVLSFVLVGETIAFLGLAIADSAGPIPLHEQGAPEPITFKGLAVLASLFSATESGSSAYFVFLCLLALPPLGVAAFAYSRLMRAPFLRTTRSPWIRVVTGAAVALIVAFMFYVLVHWWNFHGCLLCSGLQQFPPARLLNFVSRFLNQIGPIVIVTGALCALAAHTESWDEYVKRRGLEVGQLH